MDEIERARLMCSLFYEQTKDIFDQNGFDKFDPKPFDIKAFRDCLFSWQNELSENGRMALFISNHDQPRSVNRFGNISEEYRDLSAAVHANTVFNLKGNPFIYEGEEIGMTNLDYTDINDYRDIEVFNTFNDKVVIRGEDPEKWIRLFMTF